MTKSLSHVVAGYRGRPIGFVGNAGSIGAFRKAMTDSSLTNVWLFAHQKQVLVPAYRIGSRISTNSWGAIVTSYSSLDKQMDSFAYNNKDMTILVAAGNCGDVSSGCTENVSMGH